MGEFLSITTNPRGSSRVSPSVAPFDVGVWVVDGAVRSGGKRTDLAAETSVSAGGVGTSPAASVRALAFGEGARGFDERGSGRGTPLGHGDRARR